MAEKLKIKLSIADRVYPLTIDPAQEEGLRKAAKHIEQLARKFGVSDRVRFVGLVPHEKISEIYSAADISVLASANEGMPNVVLESIACGTPVVATNVGGVNEIIKAPAAGRIMADRSADSLVRSTSEMLNAPRDRHETREFARQFGWHGTIRRQLALYEQVAAP